MDVMYDITYLSHHLVVLKHATVSVVYKIALGSRRSVV